MGDFPLKPQPTKVSLRVNIVTLNFAEDAPSCGRKKGIVC